MPHPDDRLPKGCKDLEPPADGNDGDPGEIVVCGESGDDSAYYWSGSKEAAEDRIARETANAGDIPPPDVAGAGIFRGPATVSGLCGFGLNPCPPPPALLIDLEAIEESPPGSDADRVARGLAPLDNGNAVREELSEFEKQERKEALGLPPPNLSSGGELDEAQSDGRTGESRPITGAGSDLGSRESLFDEPV
ncbi:hypothetical protein HME9302_02260 [Alteripontixanthobacter maritimus]|uniref:Uncharacterized protein n=2 Tax=Alteripontixanthobacter maritimus TaxID=2161824 RepID=A0A369Q828_9SPHN|nr:hypothetical protein HME9302_02260 [Alteripontixanthobacter maritimus]